MPADAATVDKVAKVVAKIDPSVEEGDAYGALQRYRTFMSRFQKKGEFQASQQVVRAGCTTLLKHKAVSAGTDLALCLFPLYHAWSEEDVSVAQDPCKFFDDEVRPLVLAINAMYPAELSKVDRQLQVRFLRECIDLSKKWGAFPAGDPDVHFALARCLLRSAEPGASTPHFLHSQKPEEFAEAVFAIACKGGYHSELDLFAARSVLQLLATENLKDANTFHAVWLGLCREQGKSVDTPLFNFVRFVLLTLQRDALPLFNVLRTKYDAALRRDPAFQGYMDKIALKFFNVKPAQQGMAAMMSSMMEMLGVVAGDVAGDIT